MAVVMRSWSFSFLLVLLCLIAASVAPAADLVRITEFMAVNDRSLPDDDGEFSDWIEIHNGGANVVNLDGWYLTDQASNLKQWRFPATNLFPNAYLIVFASGKDRRVPGAPLHTDFRLTGEGEYLALVAPDGTTVVSEYSPIYPVQVGGVSYGLPLLQTATTLIGSGSTARILLPQDGLLGTSWTQPLFNDSGWGSVPAGVGYETDGRTPFVPVTISDSVTEFSGTQGQGNWFYGYWDRKADLDRVYRPSEFVAFPSGPGPFGPNNYWTGSTWDWFSGDPPFTRLTSQGGIPSGDPVNPALPEHVAVRRYVSEFAGPLNITGVITHTSDWVRVTATAFYPANAAPLIYVYLGGPGEGYLDNVVLVAGPDPEVGPNLIVNGDFENQNLQPNWNVSPNLINSATTTTIKHNGTRSLRIVSTDVGSSQTTAIWQNVAGLTANQQYTLSYWYLPVTNSAPLVIRFSASWMNTTPQYCSDGVLARILVDGEEVFNQPALVSSSQYALTVPVEVGSKVDFMLDPGLSGNGACDAATFTARAQTSDPTIAVVADSVADWSLTGRQGEKNWYYGYFNGGTNVAVPVYRTTDFTAFPRANGPHSTNNFWDGERWDWWNGDPPSDEIGQFEMFPTGLNTPPQHWVIRRWLSEVSGTITVDWEFLKLEAGGAGVTARIFHNGIQRDTVTLPGATAIKRSLTISGVLVGDAIDIALDPLGAGGAFGDGSDRSRLTAVIRGTPNLSGQITTDIEEDMRGMSTSAYLRIPFNVQDPAAIEFLSLRMKYDDGFVAYLNGQMVASANAPADPQWNSTALRSRSDSAASQFEEFNLTPLRGLLGPGVNVLAIHGLNASIADSDFLILPELIATTVAIDPSGPRYFTVPTPGVANGSGSLNLGPVIDEPRHTPNVPTDAQGLTVTSRVLPTLAPIGSVRLVYRVMYNNEVTTTMFDDGQHGDGVAGDGVYGAFIPATAAGPGQMMRYYVFAQDTGINSSRFPAFDDPQNSPEYLGTVVADPSLTNALPVLHMFVRDPVLATNFTGTRCSLFYDDEFYDNVSVNLHGQTTAFVFPKRSMDIDLNRGHKFRWNHNEIRVNDFNLLTPIADKAYVRQLLAYETFALAGVPTHFAFAVRLQQNGSFFGIFHFVEKGDDHFLERNKLDPNGALYKVYLPLTNAYGGVAEKKTRQNEANDDLQALINGLDVSSLSAMRQYLFDNVDIPEAINFLATIQLVQNEDCCWYKNYYLYRDSDGTGEWQIMPWDLDLTFGRTFGFFQYQIGGPTINGYYNTNIYWTNAYYTQERASYLYIGVDQLIVNSLFLQPDTYEMFFRRWSTVQEQFLQPTNTHPLLNYYERRVDELASQIAPDAALDFTKWGNWFPTQTMAVAVQVLKTEYFARRRGWIFNTLRYANGGPYLGPQPPNAVIRFGALEINPASGNQAQEYIQLTNPNSTPIDLSGWRITGAVDYKFRGGVVIPSGGSLYVSPDVKAFRARTTGPRGGQGLLVQGPYQRQLSSWGETLQLIDQNGRTVQTTNYAANPSLAQRYLRITEIMYHPSAPPPGTGTNTEAFEYIELKNIGPATLDLAGVHFTAGIEFSFTGSAVTSLGPGQTVLVVKDVVAFASRYGGGLPVAGAYSGSLENGGESIRLEDASGEKILDFSYNNSWYPVTDGAGFSLVIRDVQASWDTWGLMTSWRAGSRERGTPGADDPPPTVVAGMKVNEVLTRTEPPIVDAVELFNPTAAPINLRGWFLSDDFRTPKKFRISSDVIVAPGAYRTFTEADFNTNPGSPTSFAFSSLGDEVYLFSGDANTNLTGYSHGFSFGAAETGMSFGRYAISTGEEHLVAQNNYTPDGPNSGPRVGPVVISEIMFRPPEGADGSDNSQDEAIELRNTSGGPVNLFDPARPANTWKVAGAVDFVFPGNLTMAPGSGLLLVSFDPVNNAELAAFRARYGIAPTVPVLGPYLGKLDNSGEAIELYRPGIPDLGAVPYILVDRIDYRDTAPWPAGADGTGASLQRRNLATYGDDPANWLAGIPTLGSPTAGGTAPVIVTQPQSKDGSLAQTATFAVSANGTGPLRYQWQHDGVNLLEGTNAVLTLSNLRFDQAGSYSVAVYNSAGAALSSNATLRVALPAYFLNAPQTVRLRGSTNNADYGSTTNSSATFGVVAAGNGPLRYQWRFNGVNIPGATSSSLVVPNVDLSDDGIYDVLVTDNVGTAASPPARLIVLLSPNLVQVPLSQTVVSNGSFTASVSIRGNPPPFHYRWFETSIPRGAATIADRTNYFTSGPITNTSARTWRVIVTNEANIVATANVQFSVVAAADDDGDGLPNDWENAFGLNPADNRDANMDADEDGLSNRAEYIAGTDPKNANSYLKITSLTTGNGATLTFPVPANKVYTVQYTDSLGSGSWSKLADVLARSSNRVETLNDPGFTENRFYRLVTPMQP